MTQTKRWIGPAILATGLLAAGPASAHPHVFIDAKADVVFDDQGRITAIRNVWRFDDAYWPSPARGWTRTATASSASRS